MSQNFEISPIRMTDQIGILTGIGIEWTEEASLRHSNRVLMWVAFVICLPCTVISLGLAVAFGLPGLIGFGAFAWMTGYALYWQFGPLPRRSVVFMRDGTIRVPHGIPGHRSATGLKRRQPEVVSIEVGPCRSGMQQDWTSTVKIVGGLGQTDTISQKLHREEAREVSVGLSLALKQMRSSGERNAGSVSERHSSRALID